MPEMNAYVRVSTLDQVDGQSLEAQRIACLRMGQELQARHGCVWGPNKYGELWDDPGIFCESGVSAFKTPFFDRPAAIAACGNLRKGDFLIVSRLDRTFRSVGDFQEVWKVFQEHGVTLVSCNPMIDPTTPHGMAMMQSLIVFFQWESAIKSQRGKESAAIKKGKLPPVKVNETQEKQVHAKKLVDLAETHRKGGFEYLPPAAPGAFKRAKAASSPASGRIVEYIRNSHADAHLAGLGLENQRQQARRWSERVRELHPHLTGEPVVFYDDTVSAFKIPFNRRPAGKRAMEFLKPGDHIVFSRLDRGFRSVVDCLWTVDELRKRGVTVHFADLQFDCSSPVNRAFLAQASIFCELESQFTSARTTEAMAVLKEKRGSGGSAPSCRKWTEATEKRGGKTVTTRRLDWDKREVALQRWLYHLRYWKNMTTRQIYHHVETIMSKRDGRLFCPLGGVSKSKAAKYGLDPRTVSYKGVVNPPWMRMFSHIRRGPAYEVPLIARLEDIIIPWYESKGLPAPNVAASPRAKQRGVPVAYQRYLARISESRGTSSSSSGTTGEPSGRAS